MTAFLSLSRAIDGLNLMVGRVLSWAVIVVVVISTANALSRKFLHIGSNAWLEAQLYLFGALFLLPAGYTLLKNSHVRVDILSSRLPKRTQIGIEIFGVLFLMFPPVLLVEYYALPMFLNSFDSGERSANAGGLLLWPGKLLVLLGFGLLFLAGVSHLIKCVGFLRGLCPDPTARDCVTEEDKLVKDLMAEIDTPNDDTRRKP